MTLKGVFVGVHLAGASVTETAQLADVSRVTLFKVMAAWNSEERTSARSNSGRKHILQDLDIRAGINQTYWCTDDYPGASSARSMQSRSPAMNASWIPNEGCN